MMRLVLIVFWKFVHLVFVWNKCCLVIITASKRKINEMLCLSDLLTFVQFEKREKYLKRIVTWRRVQPATCLKVTVLHRCFSHFINCINGTKSRNAPQISVYGIHLLVLLFFFFLRCSVPFLKTFFCLNLLTSSCVNEKV